MEWDSAGPDENVGLYYGRAAVEYFETLDSAQKYHYISKILAQRSDSSLMESSNNVITFRDAVQCPFPLFPGFKYAFARARWVGTRDSILTATLFLQRRLNEDEAGAIVYWTSKQWNTYVRFWQVCLFSLAVLPPSFGRRALTTLRRPFWQDLWRRDTRMRLLSGYKEIAVFALPMIPFGMT